MTCIHWIYLSIRQSEDKWIPKWRKFSHLRQPTVRYINIIDQKCSFNDGLSHNNCVSFFSYSFITWPWRNDLIDSYRIVLCLNEDVSPSFAFKSLSSFIIAKYTCRIIHSVIIYGDKINYKSHPFYGCWPSSMVEMIKILSKWSGHNDIMKMKQNKQTKHTYILHITYSCGQFA